MSILRDLLAAVPDDVLAWAEPRHGQIHRIAEAAVSARVVAPRDVAKASEALPSLSAAIAFLRDSATMLVRTTHFDEMTGAMLKDFEGASGSTLAPLANYASLPDNVDIDAHAAAINVIRRHSHTQLDRPTFEAAAKVVQQEYERQKGAPPPPTLGAIFGLKASPKSGLSDGTAYSVDEAKHRMSLRLPLRKSGPTANDLLSAAGIPRSAYEWVAGPGEVARRWLSLDTAWTSTAAAALEKEYPVLAAALRQNAPVWQAWAPAAATEAAKPAKVASAANLDPAQGEVGNFSWLWEGGDAVTVWFPWSKEPLQRAGVRWSWTQRPKPWGAVIRLDQLDKLPNALSKYPYLAEVVPALIKAWRSAPQKVQTYEAARGRVEGQGEWRLVNAQEVALWTAWLESARGWQRKVPGVHWIAASKSWHVPRVRVLQVAAALAPHFPQLAAALQQAFGADPQQLAVDETAERPVEMLAAISGAGELSEVRDPRARAVLEDVHRILQVRMPQGKALMPYQLIGVTYARLAGYRALIGDAPGLGKTLQSIACMVVDPEKNLPALVVAPASVTHNWAKEFRTFAPAIPTMVLEGKKTIPPGFKGVVITAWSLVSLRSEMIANFKPKLLVGDEAHYIKETDPQRSKAFAALAMNTPGVLLLTGTPLKNRTIELWHPLHVLDPVTFGSRAEFGHRFSEVEEVNIGGRRVTKFFGGKNFDELRSLLSGYMVRRQKDQVLKDLPAKRRVYVPVETTPAFKKEYAVAFGRFAEWIENYMQEAAVKFAAEVQAEGKEIPSEQLNALVQERVSRSMRNANLVQIGYLRRLVGSAKVDAAIERIEEFADAEEPVVVFAEHHEVIEGIEAGLQKAGIAYSIIDGRGAAAFMGGQRRSLANRQMAADLLQDGKVNVFIGSSAAKEGLNLFRASNTIFVERWWTPADEEQAEDRIHRKGQKNAATIWMLEAEGTYDEAMRDLLDEKRMVADQAIGGTNVATQRTTMGRARTLLDILREQIKANPRRGGRFSAAALGGNPMRPEAPEMPAPERIHALAFHLGTWSTATAAHWAQTQGVMLNGTSREVDGWLLLESQPRSAFRAGTFKQIELSPTVNVVTGKP